MSDILPHKVDILGTLYPVHLDGNNKTLTIAVKDKSTSLLQGDIIEIQISGNASDIRRYEILNHPGVREGTHRVSGSFKYRIILKVTERSSA